MKKDEIVQYWLNGAREDWEFSLEIWKSGKRLYNALFFAQLSLEKTIKALHYNLKDDHPLMTHDLSLLARKLEIKMDKIFEADLKKISSFNISARYDDYKFSFRKEATKEFVKQWMNRSDEIRNHLLTLFNLA